MLISLKSLVARSCFHYSIFETIFWRTCQLAKTMGLQEGHSPRKPSLVQQAERRSLIWGLIAIDKHRVFLTGSSPHFYLCDCNLAMPKVTSSSSDHWFVPAHLELVGLMEEVYRKLYSPKARRFSPHTRDESVRLLDRHLGMWLARHQGLFKDNGDTDQSKEILRLQLRFNSFTMRIIIQRCSTQPNSRQQRLNDARAALRVIESFSSSHLLNGGLVALERLVWSR